MFIVYLIFLITTTISSKTIKIKSMKKMNSTTISSKTIKIKCMKKINPTSKFQFLNVNDFEIILKYLNFDELSPLLRACEKSKSDYLKQTILNLFQRFSKKPIQKSIEYLSFKMFQYQHAKQESKANFIIFFEKLQSFNLKTISLPKFVEHVIQTPKFRVVSHIDGFFSIEQKLKNHKQYSIMSLNHLFSPGNFNSTDLKLLNLIFSPKNFITSILNHQNYIFMIFQAGQISMCGKTGTMHICVFKVTNCTRAISHFISKDKTYFMSYFEKGNNYVVYHISSGEIFCFENTSLKSTLLNLNSKLDYNFLKNNGKSSRFVDTTNYLFNQRMTTLTVFKIDVDEMSKDRYSDFYELLKDIENL
jgi:hypothetical protein